MKKRGFEPEGQPLKKLCFGIEAGCCLYLLSTEHKEKKLWKKYLS
jgi:hypothetical protein